MCNNFSWNWFLYTFREALQMKTKKWHFLREAFIKKVYIHTSSTSKVSKCRLYLFFMKAFLTPGFWVLFAPENFELNILVIRTPILKIRHLKVNKICMRLCTHIWDKYPHPSNVFRKSCIVYIKKINNMLTYNICLSSLNM